MAQMTQAQVNYRRGVGTGQCGKCTMYNHTSPSPKATCSLVKGTIAPYGVCDRWQKMPNPFGPLPTQDRIALAHHHIAQTIRR